MKEPIVLRKSDCPAQDHPWGQLTWFASSAQGNSEHTTVGRCVIRPGMANPRHIHPNCDEVLVVLDGTIAHLVGAGRECTLTPGDTITIPADFPHQARNVGTTDAVLFVTFSSPDRQTRGE